MLDHMFCETLEYRLTESLHKIDDLSLKGFWCDGVLLSEPDNSYSQKFVNDNRQVKMKAFLGKDGQTAYVLIVKFGRRSLSRYAKGSSLIECIPESDVQDWIKIDTVEKKIEIQLE